MAPIYNVPNEILRLISSFLPCCDRRTLVSTCKGLQWVEMKGECRNRCSSLARFCRQHQEILDSAEDVGDQYVATYDMDGCIDHLGKLRMYILLDVYRMGMPNEGLGLDAYLWSISDRHKRYTKYAWGGYVEVLEDHVDPDDEVDPEKKWEYCLCVLEDNVDSDDEVDPEEEDSSGWDSSDGNFSSDFNPEEESESE
ncbi:hypothetical protein HK104_000850 [Borealophlyctis nickersoniae]|nr:hypothetical protein HK104_000850 [Borealophlyctis nickersoniae]